MKNRRKGTAWCLLGCLLLSGCTFSESPTQKLAQADISFRLPQQIFAAVPTEKVKESIPVVEKVTITATGDCTLGATQTHGYAGSFHQYYDDYGETYFFQGVRDVFENDDLTLINLECVLTTSEARVEKTWNLKGKPEYTGIMTSSSVEACSLGNNHTKDYGEASHTDTENALNEAGIVFGYNDHVGIYTTQEGVTIGIVSASLLSQNAQNEGYIQKGIEQLKDQKVDLIVACCHWGIEREYFPNDYQQTTAHRIIDWGADLVIGNHPHVLQGIEEYKGKIICYSLGNFCFGGNKNPQDKNTMMFQQTFTLINGELQPELDVTIIPCRLSSKTGSNDFQPTILSGEGKQNIIDKVNSYSAPYSSVSFDTEGKMHLDD